MGISLPNTKTKESSAATKVINFIPLIQPSKHKTFLSISRTNILTTTDLRLGHRSDPRSKNTKTSHDTANDHDAAAVKTLGALDIVAEDDSEDDTTEVARSADNAGHDAVGVRVHVRHKRVVESVCAFEEEADTSGDETDECAAVMAVRHTSDDHENTSECDICVQQDLLAPKAERAVCIVRDKTTKRTENNVEKTEHGGPVARVLESELQVCGVVVSEDAVDTEFAAEGAEVADSEDESLRRENNGEGFLERRLLDDFAADRVEHLSFSHLCFVVTEGATSLVEFLFFTSDVGDRG